MTYTQTNHSKHFHRYFVDRESNDAVCPCGKIRGGGKVATLIPKESKYHNKTSFYNGYGYDSIKEAQYAMVLDDRKKRGLIKDWERQYPIEVYVNGEKIFRMKVDFRVHTNDGSYELHEVKGRETSDFRIKLKLIDAVWLPENPEYTYILVK